MAGKIVELVGQEKESGKENDGTRISYKMA